MKHARDEALDSLEGLLAQIRPLSGLKERKRGTFYRGAVAFLHFHEDPAGPFADLKIGRGWRRMRVAGPDEERALLKAVQAELG